MSKGKARSVTAAPELHFYSSLALEHAAAVIEQLHDYPGMIESVDDDTYRFTMNQFTGHGAQVRGTIRRWEGTYTRLDCTGDVVRQSEIEARESWGTRDSRRQRNDSPVLVFGVVIMLMFWLNQSLQLPPIVFLVLALLAISATVMFYLFFLDRGDVEQTEEDKVFFRERDTMLNALISTFQAAGIVAHRPDELLAKVTDTPPVSIGLDDPDINLEMKPRP
jgi:hypothetical protein